MTSVEQALLSFETKLIGKYVKWFTNDKKCRKIFEPGRIELKL
jgi:hypothetical protein